MVNQTSLIDAFAETVRDSIDAVDAPGAAIAVAIDGRITSGGVGFRDIERTTPLDGGARFYLYSITKTLLAVAALRLVTAGRLTLGQPVRTLFPDLAVDASITFRHLLNHTGGLPDYGGMAEYQADLRADPTTPWTDDDFVARTLKRGNLFPPGEGWQYSNIGFLLVRQAIEQLTKGSLQDALAEAIFRPLGLRQTTVATSLDDTRLLTPGYSTYLSSDNTPRDISRRYHPGWVSHGVVISTAAETARIIDSLFAGELIEASLLEQMLDAVRVPEPHHIAVEPAYGLGVMLDLGSRYGRVAGHAGGGPGYSTGAFHFPDVAGHRVTAVALVNGDGGDLGFEIAFAMADVVARRFGPERLTKRLSLSDS